MGGGSGLAAAGAVPGAQPHPRPGAGGVAGGRRRRLLHRDGPVSGPRRGRGPAPGCERDGAGRNRCTGLPAGGKGPAGLALAAPR